jgi:hypothetical protein
MELFIILGYVAVCIAIFTLLRIPLNRRTVPTASIGGILLVFAFIQVLNFYHPYSDTSRQAAVPIPHGVDTEAAQPTMATPRHDLVAWFHQNNLLRLNDGSEVEVIFDSIPGKVFSGKLGKLLPVPVENRGQDHSFDPSTMASRIPVLINITDSRYSGYASKLPAGSRASTAIYGEQLQELALVRKTLLRMSAWMNYLTLPS